jgi:hypothetical protein
MVKDGHARLIRRRETYDDLLACDILEGEPPATSPPVQRAGSAKASARRRRS